MGFNFFYRCCWSRNFEFLFNCLKNFSDINTIKCYNHFQVGRVVLSISDVLCPCNHEYNISQWWMIINLIPWGKVNYLREYTVLYTHFTKLTIWLVTTCVHVIFCIIWWLVNQNLTFFFFKFDIFHVNYLNLCIYYRCVFVYCM